MSCLQNEILLEQIYDELAEEFPTKSDQELQDLTIKVFEERGLIPSLFLLFYPWRFYYGTNIKRRKYGC